MLRTRLIVGTILAALAGGMLLIDERFAPWYPFLFATVAFLAGAGTVELWKLLPPERRPRMWFVLPAVLFVVVANWLPFAHAFTATVLAAFLVEMATFREPGRSVERIAVGVWVVAYLGLLPSYLVRLRFTGDDIRASSYALALAIFVPKACDIGAYFTGRLIGRHRMTPVLSPKKTWEGAAGGLLTAVGVAFLLNAQCHIIPGGATGTVGFGLTVGLAGLLGDLAESLVKRDCQQKDASQAVPGFGGVLDVVDAILFAAPVTYWWLRPS